MLLVQNNVYLGYSPPKEEWVEISKAPENTHHCPTKSCDCCCQCLHFSLHPRQSSEGKLNPEYEGRKFARTAVLHIHSSHQ